MGQRWASGAHRDLVFDPGQLLLRLGQLGVGLLQGLPLGRHVAVDLVEAHDVDAPGAQARRGRGLGADELGVEGGVALVGPAGAAGAGQGQLGRSPPLPRPIPGSASQAPWLCGEGARDSNGRGALIFFFFFLGSLVITEKKI